MTSNQIRYLKNWQGIAIIPEGGVRRSSVGDPVSKNVTETLSQKQAGCGGAYLLILIFGRWM
jgi:hypothetical protein